MVRILTCVWWPLIVLSVFCMDTGRIDSLIEKMGDDKFTVRESAQAELEKCGRDAYKQLVKASRHTDCEIRIRSRRLVAQISKTAWATESAKMEAFTVKVKTTLEVAPPPKILPKIMPAPGIPAPGIVPPPRIVLPGRPGIPAPPRILPSAAKFHACGTIIKSTKTKTYIVTTVVQGKSTTITHKGTDYPATFVAEDKSGLVLYSINKGGLPVPPTTEAELTERCCNFGFNSKITEGEYNDKKNCIIKFEYSDMGSAIFVFDNLQLKMNAIIGVNRNLTMPTAVIKMSVINKFLKDAGI